VWKQREIANYIVWEEELGEDGEILHQQTVIYL
jgi:hypothetical protein